jgi:putative endonuclease
MDVTNMAYHLVYILACDNQTYYTGYTTNLVRRYRDHLNGKCKYTRSFKPQYVAQCWRATNKSQALKMEHFIKSCKRTEKERLIAEPLLMAKYFESAHVHV